MPSPEQAVYSRNGDPERSNDHHGPRGIHVARLGEGPDGEPSSPLTAARASVSCVSEQVDHLDSGHEDEMGYTFPSKPSELRNLSNERLFRLWRKIAYENKHPFDRMVEHEMNTRLIVALSTFKKAADRSARTLSLLTVVLVVLTAVLVVLAVRG